MGTTGKIRQHAFRRRMQERGYQQVAVWLDSDACTALRLLVASEHTDASAVISEAVRHYHAYIHSKAVTSDNKVTKIVTSNNTAVTSNRRLSLALEDHILALRQSGLSLSAISRQLMDEGYSNAKGEPYSTTTISKVETRAKARCL